MKKITLLIFLITLFYINLAYAVPVGVSGVDSSIQITPGASERFRFQIQNVISSPPTPALCNVGFNSEPFNVELDEPSPITIDADSIYIVKATITAPQSIPPGTYKRSYSVSCQSLTSTGQLGTAVVEGHSLSFEVEVVDQRNRENPYVPPKVEKPLSPIVYLAILVVLIAALMLVISSLKKKSQRRKR